MDSFEDVELTFEGSRVWWGSGYIGSASNITTSSSQSVLGKGINFNCFAFYKNINWMLGDDRREEVSERTF